MPRTSRPSLAGFFTLNYWRLPARESSVSSALSLRRVNPYLSTRANELNLSLATYLHPMMLYLANRWLPPVSTRTRTWVSLQPFSHPRRDQDAQPSRSCELNGVWLAQIPCLGICKPGQRSLSWCARNLCSFATRAPRTDFPSFPRPTLSLTFPLGSCISTRLSTALLVL